MYIAEMPKSLKNSTWSPCLGGLPKIENFKIFQNLLRWIKTNIESNCEGYQARTGSQKKNSAVFTVKMQFLQFPPFPCTCAGKWKVLQKFHFHRKTAEIFFLVPRTGMITPKVTFYISFDPSEQVLTDFEIFDFW